MTEPVPESVGSIHSLADHRAAKDATTAPATPDPTTVPVPTTATATAPGAAVAVEAVDRPDNPLADWLTVPDAPVLPVWARSRASITANVTALGRLTWWHGRYHGVRTPKYLAKAVLLAARGFYRAVAGLWPTLSAQDHTAAVKALRAQTKVQPGDVDLAVRLQVAHAARTQTRRWRFGTAATAVATAAVGVVLAPPLLQTGIAAAITVPLAYLGRGRETQFLDQGAPPLRVDMSAQQLNDALRAAALLKTSGSKEEKDLPKVSCTMGPVRDGRGWAVIFDMPRGGGKTASDVLAKRRSSRRNSGWMRSRSSCPASAPRRAATRAGSRCGSPTMTPTSLTRSRPRWPRWTGSPSGTRSPSARTPAATASRYPSCGSPCSSADSPPREDVHPAPHDRGWAA